MLTILREKALSGDKAAEKELFKQLLVRFTFLAKKRLWSNSAEDIAQDACLTVFEKYRELEDGIVFEAWANQVLRNKIGNLLQKSDSEKKYLSSVRGIDPNLTESDTEISLRIDIERCLGKIAMKNKRYFDILVLARDGFKTEEICHKLNITPGNLYVILERSRSKLKECLNIGVENE